MLIVYDSMTGNVESFIRKVGFPSARIKEGLVVTEPYVLVTYTVGFGEVPPATDEFLKRNSKHLIGVAASGHRNWGQTFAMSADKIARRYGVPLIHKFELSGTPQDVVIFKEGVLSLYEQV